MNNFPYRSLELLNPASFRPNRKIQVLTTTGAAETSQARRILCKKIMHVKEMRNPSSVISRLSSGSWRLCNSHEKTRFLCGFERLNAYQNVRSGVAMLVHGSLGQKGSQEHKKTIIKFIKVSFASKKRAGQKTWRASLFFSVFTQWRTTTC